MMLELLSTIDIIRYFVEGTEKAKRLGKDNSNVCLVNVKRKCSPFDHDVWTFCSV
jgi:hypothetical protein